MPIWREPAVEPLDDAVHVWPIALDVPDETVADFYVALDAAERERSQRFFADTHRRRFIVSHGAVRMILGRYLGVAPACLRFETLLHGKPVLAREFSDTQLQFNLAHSHELAALAVTRDRPVGIDIEWVRPFPDIIPVAEHVFSPSEAALWRTIPTDSGRTRAFFNCWTRKEALLKAVGDGLTRPLASFAVSFLEGEPARLLDATAARPLDGWAIRDWEPHPAYVGAVVVAGSEIELVSRSVFLGP